ncbi:MAG: hypothetical protein ACK4XI_08680, partial [Bacteroidota bacterium]
IQRYTKGIYDKNIFGFVYFATSYGYDASGNRLWKNVTPKGSGAVISTYYYLRDAQGNEMCRYVNLQYSQPLFKFSFNILFENAIRNQWF